MGLGVGVKFTALSAAASSATTAPIESESAISAPVVTRRVGVRFRGLGGRVRFRGLGVGVKFTALTAQAFASFGAAIAASASKTSAIAACAASSAFGLLRSTVVPLVVRR